MLSRHPHPSCAVPAKGFAMPLRSRQLPALQICLSHCVSVSRSLCLSLSLSASSSSRPLSFFRQKGIAPLARALSLSLSVSLSLCLSVSLSFSHSLSVSLSLSLSLLPQGIGSILRPPPSRAPRFGELIAENVKSTQAHTHARTRTHTHTHTLSLSLSLSLTRACGRVNVPGPTGPPNSTLSLSLSLSLLPQGIGSVLRPPPSRAPRFGGLIAGNVKSTQAHTHARAHTHTLSLSLSLSPGHADGSTSPGRKAHPIVLFLSFCRA